MANFDREREVLLAMVRKGSVSKENAQKAYQAARQAGVSALEAVVRMGFAQQDEVDAVAAEMPAEMLSLQQVDIEPGVVHYIDRETAERLRAVPFQRRGDVVDVAMADPDDLHANDELSRAIKARIRPVRVAEADIIWAIESFWSEETTKDLEADYGTSRDGLVDGDPIARLMDAPAIVQLASALISEGVERRASDIHLEPLANGFIVRYRIDGVLEPVMRQKEPIKAPLISRIKIMADMDIAESRVPQDGRFTTTVKKRRIDVRVSSRPTIFGEKLVLRILDKTRVIVSMDKLGFPEGIAQAMKTMLHVSRGLIAVVGPTGSGKTTTLYAALHHLRSDGINIESVEDPVEYQMNGINQAHARPDIGLGFAEHLRSILRQDPDVILVGEMRDRETADMAFRGALTGHLVLTTAHANDAPAALLRFIEMGVEPYLVSSALRCIISQRLARRLCENCRVAYPAETATRDLPILADLLQKHGVDKLYRGRGCERCRNSGYMGRIGLFEMLRMSSKMRDLIHSSRSELEVRELALKEGMEPMEADAVRKMIAGETSIESLLSIYADRMIEFGDEVAVLLDRQGSM